MKTRVLCLFMVMILLLSMSVISYAATEAYDWHLESIYIHEDEISELSVIPFSSIQCQSCRSWLTVHLRTYSSNWSATNYRCPGIARREVHMCLTCDRSFDLVTEPSMHNWSDDSSIRFHYPSTTLHTRYAWSGVIATCFEVRSFRMVCTNCRRVHHIVTVRYEPFTCNGTGVDPYILETCEYPICLEICSHE